MRKKVSNMLFCSCLSVCVCISLTLCVCKFLSDNFSIITFNLTEHRGFTPFGGEGPFLQEDIAFASPGIGGGGGGFGVQAHPPPPQASSAPDREGVDGGSSASEPPRTDFPETWLWDLVTIP